MYILIVDNDASIRKAVSMGLSRGCWIIDGVPANHSCISDLMSRYQYDLIIIDCDIAEMAIWDAIREGKQKNPDLIVVAMTRNSISDCVIEDNTELINSCYQKPLHLDMLKKAIDLELQKLALA